MTCHVSLSQPPLSWSQRHHWDFIIIGIKKAWKNRWQLQIGTERGSAPLLILWAESRREQETSSFCTLNFEVLTPSYLIFLSTYSFTNDYDWFNFKPQLRFLLCLRFTLTYSFFFIFASCTGFLNCLFPDTVGFVANYGFVASP